MKEKLYIVEGVRTPFCKMGTTLARSSAVELGRAAVSQLIARTGIDPAMVDETIIGCVGQPPEAANLARVIALRSGIPAHVPAVTVHRNCASGFEAITSACEKAAAGHGEVFIVGGAESMSSIPLFFHAKAKAKFEALMRARKAGQRFQRALEFRLSDFKPRIGLKMGLTDPVCGLNMGETAEVLARDFGIDREKQDYFAMLSHHKALAAVEALRQEICPFYPSAGKVPVVEDDNGPRENQSMEALQKLRPVFEKKGTVTAGNASQITDGAVALLVVTEKALKKHGLTPMARIAGYQYAGCEPRRMGLGPVYAIARAQESLGLKIRDADFIEINEAFASQVLACQAASASDDFARKALGRKKALGEIPDELLNVNGGAIALGHPVGATGSRLALTACHELERRKGKRALLSLCVGGGQGGALWIERN